MDKNPRQIWKDVHEHLNWDSRLHAQDVRVNVEKGKVILEGHVPSYTQLMEAEDDAYAVAGVKKVDNLLSVKVDAGRRLPTDAEMEAAIRDALAWQSDVDISSINVAVNKGVAVLNGTVESFPQRISAERVAGGIRGVTAVNNRILVKRLDAEDAQIRDSVISALGRTLGEASKEIGVAVRDGVVRLNGKARRCSDARQAEKIAEETRGVAGIRNAISLP